MEILMLTYLNKPTYTHEYWKGHGTSMLEIQVSTWELLLPGIWPFAIPTPIQKKKSLEEQHKIDTRPQSEHDLGNLTYQREGQKLTWSQSTGTYTSRQQL